MEDNNLIEQQLKLSKKIIEFDDFKKLEFIAGIDVHYFDNGVIIGYAVFSYSQQRLIETKKCFLNKLPSIQQYKPEFFCFYEGPYIIEFLKNIKIPDILIINGHGVAHPRRMGLASYVGVVYNIATIGCANKLLYGSYDRNLLAKTAGSFVEIKDKENKVIGYALRTKQDQKEIIISSGTKVALKTAKDVVLKFCKFRIPEPLRLAHILAKSDKI